MAYLRALKYMAGSQRAILNYMKILIRLSGISGRISDLVYNPNNKKRKVIGINRILLSS